MANCIVHCAKCGAPVLAAAHHACPEDKKPQPHKHADLIKAWADGAEIEFRIRNPNGKPSVWSPISNPGWVEDFEYRIKPERHKWQKEMDAFKAGKVIQHRLDSDDLWIDCPNPVWHTSVGHNYRVKPDPVKARLYWFRYPGDVNGIPLLGVLKEGEDKTTNFVDWATDWLTIEKP